MGAAIELAERGRLPDWLIRRGMDRVVSARLAGERRIPDALRTAFWEEAWRGPIAVAPDLANTQHYEVPAGFFDLVLGTRRKYSSGFWPHGVDTLDDAEEAMLRLTAERAGIVDGDTILDLGCGWGSFTLWAAEHFPASEVLGVSNSTRQRTHILGHATRRGLDNVSVVTADINDFDALRRFDRIVSVEMFEHVRNHKELFRRLRGWVTDGGSVFVHVFAHQEFAYPYETTDRASWMAETFFSGGVMPSRRLLPEAAAPHFALAGDWWLEGDHYVRTLEAWLAKLDGRVGEARTALLPVYGEEVDRWIGRWRMFFMACAALFGHGNGTEWGIAHHRFTPE